MQIRYRNTLNELVALQKHALRHTEVGKKMMLHRFIAVESIFFLIALMFAINNNPLVVLLVFLGVSGLAWLFRERSVLLQFRRDFKRERRKDESGMFEKERLLTIDPDGLTVVIGDQRTNYEWDEVVYAGKDRKNVYIIMTGVLHYVIPLTAFADENEPDAFLASIDSYRT